MRDGDFASMNCSVVLLPFDLRVTLRFGGHAAKLVKPFPRGGFADVPADDVTTRGRNDRLLEGEAAERVVAIASFRRHQRHQDPVAPGHEV